MGAGNENAGPDSVSYHQGRSRPRGRDQSESHQSGIGPERPGDDESSLRSSPYSLGNASNQ